MTHGVPGDLGVPREEVDGRAGCVPEGNGPTVRRSSARLPRSTFWGAQRLSGCVRGLQTESSRAVTVRSFCSPCVERFLTTPGMCACWRERPCALGHRRLSPYVRVLLRFHMFLNRNEQNHCQVLSICCDQHGHRTRGYEAIFSNLDLSSESIGILLLLFLIFCRILLTVPHRCRSTVSSSLACIVFGIIHSIRTAAQRPGFIFRVLGHPGSWRDGKVAGQGTEPGSAPPPGLKPPVSTSLGAPATERGIRTI